MTSRIILGLKKSEKKVRNDFTHVLLHFWPQKKSTETFLKSQKFLTFLSDFFSESQKVRNNFTWVRNDEMILSS
jgi:hypothetical protein